MLSWESIFVDTQAAQTHVPNQIATLGSTLPLLCSIPASALLGSRGKHLCGGFTARLRTMSTVFFPSVLRHLFRNAPLVHTKQRFASIVAAVAGVLPLKLHCSYGAANRERGAHTRSPLPSLVKATIISLFRRRQPLPCPLFLSMCVIIPIISFFVPLLFCLFLVQRNPHQPNNAEATEHLFVGRSRRTLPRLLHGSVR